MKRIAIGATVTVVLILLTVVAVRAHSRGTRGCCGHRWHHPGPISFLTRDLKLSDAQRMQIRTLWQMERPIISTHIHEFLTENKEMNAIDVQENPDPTKVEEIAGREATTIAMLLVEKERLQSKIYRTVLNPEQRTKAHELQKKWESRLDRAADRLRTQTAE
jgi:Spy/CpxP family protein refolding chaperone